MADDENAVNKDTPTTGHVWDGIREYDNPLPRWWAWIFYASIAWALVYCVLYPALPLVDGAPKGLLGYSSRAELVETMKTAEQAKGGTLERIKKLPLKQIAADAELRRFAVAGGKSAYAVNCVQCHGSGAAGSLGYPNLNDDAWLWGGKLEDIYFTIRHGIRHAEDENTRNIQMPAFGREKMLTAEQIGAVTAYVRKLAGLETDAKAAASGAPIYKENCEVCHKADGSGDPKQGAPNLKDAIWLYGSSHDAIATSIETGRGGVMPAWGGKLDEAVLKKLAIFVHALGGGE